MHSNWISHFARNHLIMELFKVSISHSRQFLPDYRIFTIFWQVFLLPLCCLLLFFLILPDSLKPFSKTDLLKSLVLNFRIWTSYGKDPNAKEELMHVYMSRLPRSSRRYRFAFHFLTYLKAFKWFHTIAFSMASNHWVYCSRIIIGSTIYIFSSFRAEISATKF